VVALAATGTIVAVSAQPAQAAHRVAAQTAAHRDDVCVPAPSPRLAGFRQGMVAIPGDSLHYVIGGSGPAILLIHGWPMTWWEWNTVMPNLAQTHTVIALDLPGLGNSTVPTDTPADGGYTTPDAATRLHEAVAALGYGNVSIMAHDLGVGIAYAYARLYPQSVNRVMVMESELNGFGLENIFPFSFHFGLNMSPSPIPEGIINNRLAVVTYLNFLFDFSDTQAAITTQDRHVWYDAYSCAANREAGWNYYRAMPQDKTWDLANSTPKLTIPVVAMGGGDSMGPGPAQSFANVDTDVHTVVVANSGHYIPEEQPAFVNECASLFFSADPNVQAPSGFEACRPA
jgi:pimeloyl-ACP methyl ester carboxylesterase